MSDGLRDDRTGWFGEQGFASNDDDPSVGFSTFLFVIVFPRHCVRAPDADGGILLT